MTVVSPPSPQTRVASNAAWVIGWRLSTRILGFVSTFVLVRLLAPTDFGLIMLATTFTDAVDALSTVGIQDAIVRERAPDRAFYDTAFTMNAIRAVAMGAVIGAAAWPVAAFFSEPKLASVLAALALMTAMGAAENVRVVDFRREMAFQQEFKLFLLPRLAAILSCIAAAAVWHSYWALVVGLMTNRLLQLALGYLLCPYQPRLHLGEWRKIIGFSAWTWLSSLAALVRDRSDNIVIGRMLGVTQIGLFSVGAELAALPTTELVSPLCRVLFPNFTKLRSAGGDLANLYLQTIEITVVITMPAGVGISLIARPLIAFVFGSQWSASAPIVAVLAIAGTLKAISLISGTLFAALGLLTANFRIIVATALVRLALLLLLVQTFGLVGAAIAILLSVVVEEGMFLVAAARELGFPALELPRRIWRSLAASAVMAVTLSSSGLGWSGPVGDPAAILFVAVPLGIATYLGALAAAWVLAGRPNGAEISIVRAAARTWHGRPNVLRTPWPIRRPR